MLSFISVPPMSLHPASNMRAPPGRPSLTQLAWMFGMSPSKAIRATAWMSTHLVPGRPGRDRPCR